ncbi:hypothetical protein N7471_001640 [Penicillium samsonianum]|uniref:uncharacterized protein n=1 Tax=Penicillium samsonianum TaxID=1882272 RepID=UPI002547E96C|nr:uncharacterized protein N7471_001640 [Penicillium samsonianum]KAJ6150441.1 hypothetical protein N7471_001640 [Penicillium samsonianum]
MVVRILCLHGMGVNGDIFSFQTAGLQSQLPSNYVFFFANAPETCDPAPGMGDFFSGPYRCWYNTPTTSKVAAAHHFVQNIIEQNGPFDGVIGFSQGAAVAASMILHHQLESPEERSLFSFAIFIGSPIPFSKSLDHGIDLRGYFGLETFQKFHQVRPGCPTVIPSYLVTDKTYLRGETELEGKALCGLSGSFYQMFHPTVDSARISIPVAHVYGSNDPWIRHSIDLVGLCDSEKTYVVEHDGAHEIPGVITDELCDVVENTAYMAGCY